MADVISDQAVVRILRPFVRATRPVLDGLREIDPFDLRTRAGADGAGRAPATGTCGPGCSTRWPTLQVPGTAAWAAMTPPERTRWWVRRVGRFTTLVAAVPGIGGALANRLPVSKTIGAAGQGLLLVAIAGEYGVRDEDELVALLGAVLFRRDLTVTAPDPAADAEADTRAIELTGDLAAKGERPTLQRVAAAVWHLGRTLFAVEDELDKRPHGNRFHSGLGQLPVVGAVGKYLGEWSGLKRAAAEAEERLTAG
jgi:hypothetical protein